jgi:hypothetical protein
LLAAQKLPKRGYGNFLNRRIATKEFRRSQEGAFVINLPPFIPAGQAGYPPGRPLSQKPGLVPLARNKF